jgi:small-conductance mechanosensitive channel
VFTNLKELDQSKVSEALGTLGKSFQIVEAASRLIRRGLEKLKSVINALSDLFGSDAMADVKTKVQDVWKKFTNDNALVRNIIGLPAAQTRVRDFAQRAGQQLLTLDSLSRELALLEDKFQGKRNLLGGLEKAIVLAMSILAALQVFGLWPVAPWTVLAAAGAYTALIGAALLVGMNYTGSRRFVGWVRGVYEIAT